MSSSSLPAHFVLQPLTALRPDRIETAVVLKKLALASRKLAELKGVAASIPNQSILISTLGIQEAKDSSAIENIVTTHDELFKDDAFPEAQSNPAAKEVMRYREALQVGFQSVRKTGLITCNDIIRIQSVLERNNAGFRKLPGTTLKDGAGRTVYTPPQEPEVVVSLMRDLEQFLNDADVFEADPLVKMALAHHQFESIHPFYDGNGRTGRILNVLYLVKEELLDIPVLYMSRYIVRTKANYYRLLQTVRERNAWEAWLTYMLTGVEQSASEAIAMIKAITAAQADVKQRVRVGYKFYSQDLINNLFMHPYTKIEYVERDLNVSRLTATKYLDTLAQDRILEKRRVGRYSYYINIALRRILVGDDV